MTDALLRQIRRLLVLIALLLPTCVVALSQIRFRVLLGG